MEENETMIGLVTGASDGIGKETARQLAAKGLKIIVGSRNLEKGEQVISDLRDSGVECDLVALDITDPASVQAAARDLSERYGHLDLLVNNAGIALDRGPLHEMAYEDFVTTFQTNVFGTFLVTQAFLPLLRRSKRARIVNVSSSLASLIDMNDSTSRYYNIALPAYAASKAAINVMTVHLARELKADGIKVNAVEPGLTATRYVSLPGAQTVEVGAEASVIYSLIDDNGPTGGFFDRTGPHNW